MHRMTFAEAALRPAIEETAAKLAIETGRHRLWIERRLKEEMDEFMAGAVEISPELTHVLATIRFVCDDRGWPCETVREH